MVVLDRETNRLSSQVNTQQRDRESLQGDMEKLQKDFKTLQAEVSGESKKVHADFLLRLENLQTEVRTLGTGIEEYKELSKKPSKEMDRLKENIALRTKALEDKEKILDDRDRLDRPYLDGRSLWVPWGR